MAIDHSSIPEYTDAELLKIYRHAEVQILLGGQSYTIGGRQYTRASLRDLHKKIEDLQARIDYSGSIALARFNRPA
jgi:hypothetical protein